ncbi:MAG: flagellar biosynthesis protein FlhF [Bacillota bacterium]|nr:flagellar biosynthesis protein FlhF [Bacillota bacterium]MDD3850116.1 flagellar biosynthesis protein FlhF [Bacillota bacterium]MDD4706839.1 flagellar biosynthesis protein FlhF [Bacillota bacterium]
MKVKRYVGPTVEVTLDRVREEMGRNAVILNRRKIKPGKGLMRIFKKPVYEIVAAIDETEPGAGIPVQDLDDGYQALERKMDYLKATMDTIAGNLSPKDSNREIPEILSPYYTLMKDNDIDPEIIHMVMEGVKSKIDLSTTYDQEYLYYRFKQEISSYFKKVEPISLKEGQTTVAVFVGPTGVGKTTSLAKLAAYYAVIIKKRVGIMTCDTYRIAAVEQLKTYGEIMDVPIRIIYQPGDIEDAMQYYKDMDLILVDTAGRSHRDRMRLLELQKMLKGIGNQQVFLVVSATTNYKNVLDIISSYNFLKDYRILISKVDENVSNGIILNIAVKCGRPLSYITTGQNVPDDIEKVDGERIASLILSMK